MSWRRKEKYQTKFSSTRISSTKVQYKIYWTACVCVCVLTLYIYFYCISRFARKTHSQVKFLDNNFFFFVQIRYILHICSASHRYYSKQILSLPLSLARAFYQLSKSVTKMFNISHIIKEYVYIAWKKNIPRIFEPLQLFLVYWGKKKSYNGQKVNVVLFAIKTRKTLIEQRKIFIYDCCVCAVRYKINWKKMWIENANAGSVAPCVTI